MAYTPIPITSGTISSNLIRNIYRLVEEYQVANSYITIQDREKESSYPLYTLYIPKIERLYTDNKRTTVNIPTSVNIDFDALPGDGDWQKIDEMYEALVVGIENEIDNLKIAGLTYKGSYVLSSEPIDINGQQVFCKTAKFEFIISL